MKRSLVLARPWTRRVPGVLCPQVLFNHVHSPASPSPAVRPVCLRNFATVTRSDDHTIQSNHAKKKKQYPPKLLDRTKYLLDPSSQLDSTDPNLWTEADHILRAWLDESFSSDLTALKRVECCLRILDRLSNILPKGEIFFVSLLDRDLLRELLKTWRIGLGSCDTSDANLRRLFTPSFLAARIDKYRWTSLLQPDASTFNLLLNAAPMFPYRDGIAFADCLLQKLVQVSRAEEAMEMPLMDVVSVATVMQAWVNQKRPEKAEEWLSRLESWQRDESHTHLGRLFPNKVVYTTVLSGWAKAGNAQNALDILERQMASFSQGNLDCRPDTATFNCVLDALAKSKDRTGWAPKMAQHVLEQMEEFGTPDAHTWTTLISCFVRHKPSEAEKLLRQLEENGAAVPVSAYNAMLSGYAHTGNVRAATNLLAKLEASNESSPDIVSYNTVLSAYSRLKTADATQQAETFFRRILEQKGITANVATYGAMMKCWSKSSDADAADRVEAILRGMNDTGPAPNTACYNIVLSAWGNQAALRGRNDSYALDRMIQVFEEMATGDAVRPDDNTFRALMHAILGSSTPNKGEVLDFLVPVMKRHGFRPSGKDEQLFRRCLKHHSQWKAGELP